MSAIPVSESILKVFVLKNPPALAVWSVSGSIIATVRQIFLRNLTLVPCHIPLAGAVLFLLKYESTIIGYLT